MTQGSGLLQQLSGFAFFRNAVRQAVDAWDQFWFKPTDPLMLGIIRLLCGWMLFYNLLIWTLDLAAFFGDHGLQPLQAVKSIYESRRVFSFWLWTGDKWLWPMHLTCLLISGLFCIGFATRVTSVLAFLITISYSQRVPIANFGFDQILGLLCLYLSVGPSGAAISVDSLIRKWRLRRKGETEDLRRFASAQVAMRLIQLHLCAIYFWAGFAKLKGPTWWTGEAMWRVLANQEYQTMDLTWMAWMPWLPFLIAHVTIAWEVFFIVLIWNRRLRPLMLLMGVAMHVGIGAFLGMWTFGLIMAFAYLAFSDPDVWRRRMSIVGRWIRRKPMTADASSSTSAASENRASSNLSLTSSQDTPQLVSATDSLVHALASKIDDSLSSESRNEQDGRSADSMPLGTEPSAAEEASPAKVVCVVSAASIERSSLRRYLKEHHLGCRAVADFNSGLDVVSRYRLSAVLINSSQFTAENVIDFVADVSDLTDLPVLVMLSPQHTSLKASIEEIQNASWLALPATLREIRLKLEPLVCETHR